MTGHKYFLGIIALIIALLPNNSYADVLELKPHRVQLHYSGHLVFESEEVAAEGEWLFRQKHGGWFPELGVASGLGFVMDFDFFEIPFDARANFYKFSMEDWGLGIGLSLVNGFGFTSASANVLPPRACVFSPIGYDRWSVHIDYCVNIFYGSMKAGLGVAYEL